jgi:oligosaccharide repeat unit polymerase
MSILILALVILLLIISWNYIIRIEPAGLFAAMWALLITVIIGCQGFVIIRYTGLLFILACVYSFLIGTIFVNTYYHPIPCTNINLKFNKKVANTLLVALFFAAFVNPIYTVILHGFSISSIFNIVTLLQMNNTISVDRYSGADYTNTFNQLMLVFSYSAPLFGGFCYRLVDKFGKTFSLLSIVPCIFVAFTQAMKMGLITSVFLWFCGFLVCSFTYNLQIRIKTKTLFLITGGSIGFFSLLFLSMILRTGEISDRIVEDITNKFFTYAFGFVPCFDIWFDSSNVSEYTYGAKSFFGVSNALGILERLDGIYQEWIPFGKDGFKGESNVYTVFRVLVEDFGPAPSCLVMLLLGGLSSIVMQNLNAKKNIYLNQILMAAIYSYIMWSFVTSFFAYTSYLVMFFVVYLLLNIVQEKENNPISI